MTNPSSYKHLGHSVLISWLPVLYIIDLVGYSGTVVHRECETLKRYACVLC
jgi:hypothetical protein